MKILVTGVNGQVGYELVRSMQSLGQVVALDRQRMDLANLDQVREVIRAERPDLIVNPAAYTAVDKAEEEEALAMRINGEAPGVMAEEAARLGAAMLHYSTDYVFDGTKVGAYTEDDPVCPVSVYGRSKLAGEQAVQAAGIPYLILRTSWVYGIRGKNFLLTMRRLAAEREELRIVADQHGAPTWCRTIADTSVNIVTHLNTTKDTPQSWQATPTARTAQAKEQWQAASGIYHLAAQGQTTWHGFAQAIVDHLAQSGQLSRKPKVTPIGTKDYPLPAARPQNSHLSCERLQTRFCRLPDWQTGLDLCLES